MESEFRLYTYKKLVARGTMITNFSYSCQMSPDEKKKYTQPAPRIIYGLVFKKFPSYNVPIISPRFINGTSSKIKTIKLNYAVFTKHTCVAHW